MNRPNIIHRPRSGRGYPRVYTPPRSRNR
jgi:hypothetical protein